jgi:hypothetical protein
MTPRSAVAPALPGCRFGRERFGAAGEAATGEPPAGELPAAGVVPAPAADTVDVEPSSSEPEPTNWTAQAAPTTRVTPAAATPTATDRPRRTLSRTCNACRLLR